MPPADLNQQHSRLDVLVVSSWFPAYDDPAAGRFVADQVEALTTTGAVDARIVSFDQARLSGGARARQRQADAVLAASTAAIGSQEPLFLAPAWGVDRRLPVGRLSVPDGATTAAGAEHLAVHREIVLRALGERLSAEMSSGSRGIVHAHTAYPDGAAAAVLAERLGWPFLVTEHSSFVERIIAVPALRVRYEKALSRADAVIAVSETLAVELRAWFPDHAAKIRVVPNAVPFGLFRPAALGARVRDQLLFVGRRKDTKGIEVLLRAVAHARAQRPTISLRLLGRAPDQTTEERWKALSRELGLVDAVTFEDADDRPTIAAAMAGASLFVHPSPRETFGVVAVEALASGTPVVATDSGGVTEIMGHEPDRLGALVARDDPEALAVAILATLDRRTAFDPAVLRAAVEGRFGAEFVAEKLLDVYRQAAAGFRATAATVASPERGSWSGGSPTHRGSATIVVALDRSNAIMRLAPMPRLLRGEITLVTARPEGNAADAARDLDLARIVEVELVGAPAGRGARGGGQRQPRGRAARLKADPIGSVLRMLGRGIGSPGWTDPATTALLALLREDLLDGGGDGLPEIVAVDGHDHLAVAPLVREGHARLSAGGLRRVADRWLREHEAPGLDES